MKFLAIASVLSLALAAPAGTALPPGTYQVTTVDKFDDLAAFPITSGIISQVGVYHGFNYTGFGVSSDLISVLGNTPTTPPNFIYGDPVTTSTLQLLPANGKVIHFELCYLNYACATIGSVGVAQKCTIQITGQKEAAAGGGTVVQELVYDPALLGSSYAFASLQSTTNWQKLVSVTINILNPLTPQPATIALFDNIGYLTLYHK